MGGLFFFCMRQEGLCPIEFPFVVLTMLIYIPLGPLEQYVDKLLAYCVLHIE